MITSDVAHDDLSMMSYSQVAKYIPHTKTKSQRRMEDIANPRNIC
jgi:hypothetical protein